MPLHSRLIRLHRRWPPVERLRTTAWAARSIPIGRYVRQSLGQPGRTKGKLAAFINTEVPEVPSDRHHDQSPLPGER